MGVIGAEDIVELGELATGARKGCTADEQITYHKNNNGTAAAEIAVAMLAYELAKKAGRGTRIDLIDAEEFARIADDLANLEPSESLQKKRRSHAGITLGQALWFCRRHRQRGHRCQDGSGSLSSSCSALRAGLDSGLMELTPNGWREASEAPHMTASEYPARLLNRNFVLLWQGQAVSQLFTSVYSIAMVFWVKHATESGSLIGLLMMASSIPTVLLSTVGGGFADRFSRRTIMIWCDVVGAAALIVLAGLFYTVRGPTRSLLFCVFVVEVCLSITRAFTIPAMSASIPDLVPQDSLERANALYRLTRQLSLFGGRGLGGTLFRFLGTPLLVFLNALSFLLAAGTKYFVHIPQDPAAHSMNWRDHARGLKKGILEGMRHVWNHAGLKRLVLASAFVNFFTMPIIVLLPFYVEDYLAVNSDWYGILLAVQGVGIVIGTLCSSVIKLEGSVRANVLIILVITNSLNAAVLGLTHSLATAVGISLGIGAIMGFASVYFVSIVQKSTPSDIRGRVFGFWETVARSAAPLGMGFGGIAFDLLDRNIPFIYVTCGVMMALLAFFMWQSREFRNFLACE